MHFNLNLGYNDLSMDILNELISILTSVNKISLVAFFITLGFLLYELYLFRKEGKRTSRPNIPQFNESIAGAPIQTKVVKNDDANKTRPSNRLGLLIAFVLVIFFGIISLFGLINLKKNPAKETGTASSGVTFLSSTGIKVFDSSWQEIKNEVDVRRLNSGDKIFIGVETIDGIDIDRARIRVNGSLWRVEDIVTQFNKDYKVFYREYFLATGTANLKIESQLHSAGDGWLGD